MATSSPPDGSDPSDELPRADSPSPESHQAASRPGDKIAFAPTDYTDGRELLDWESHYPPLAKRAIRVEIAYLATGVVVSLTILFGIGIRFHERLLDGQEAQLAFACYLSAIAAGYLGGALFSVKWLYHTIAKKTWHLDRRPWRFLSPLLSSGLALAVMLMVQAQLVSVLNKDFVATPVGSSALGFLVGYFTDNTLAKLTEIAESLFGVNPRAPRGHGKE